MRPVAKGESRMFRRTVARWASLTFFTFLLAAVPWRAAAGPGAYRWANVALGGGGFHTGLLLHPLQRDLAYSRTDVGGFYRWDAGSERWTPLTDRLPISERNYYGGE